MAKRMARDGWRMEGENGREGEEDGREDVIWGAWANTKRIFMQVHSKYRRNGSWKPT